MSVLAMTNFIPERKVKATVEILKVSTGEKRYYETEVYFAGSDHFAYEPGEFMDYIWTEGNYACDCNRAIFFGDKTVDEIMHEGQCGNVLYKIPKIVTEDGIEILIDKIK